MPPVKNSKNRAVAARLRELAANFVGSCHRCPLPIVRGAVPATVPEIAVETHGRVVVSTKRFPGGIELVAVVNHGSDRLFRQP
jgi:hypothetical protein